MSTSQKQLIDAIRRIAKSDPEVETLLKAFVNRGTLKGGKFFDAPQSDDSCCSGEITQVGEPGDEGTGTGAPDISGDAPPDMSGGTPEGWTDCSTGQPINFTPSGFPQPETCKGDCERPDPTWQAGYYWHVTNTNRCTTGGSTPQEAGVRYYITTGGGSEVPGGPWQVFRTDSEGTPTGYQRLNDQGGWVVRAYRISCPGLGSCNYCTDKAPIISDCQDWQPDSTTNYTLANGCITGSSCDPDATEQAKQCNEQIIICDENGNERIIQSIGNGQFIMYDPSGEHKGGRYNSATGERLEILDSGSNGGYGSIE